MNGDLQELYLKLTERLTVIETKQQERHEVNKSDIDALFNKLGKLDDLQCQVHSERMVWLDKSVKCLGGVLIVGSLITMALKYWSS